MTRTKHKPRTRSGRGEKAAASTAGHLARLKAEVQDLREQLTLERDGREAQEHSWIEAQRGLKLSHEWQTTFDSVADAIWVMDPDCHIIRCNQAARQLLGKGDKGLVGRRCWEIIHGTTAPIPDCPVQRLRHSHQRETAEVTLEGHWYRSTVDPIFDSSGELSGMVHVLEDINERKEAELKVAASEKRFRALTENAAEDIILLDADGTIIYESPHEVPLLGFAPGEMTGRSGLELVHPEDLPQARQTLATVLQSPGAKVDGELRMRRKEGGWSWIHYHATNLLQEPAVGAVVLNLNNVTARKQAEEALQGHVEHLALLSDAAGALLTATDPDMFLNGIFARLSDVLGLEVCIQFALAPGGCHLELKLSRGLSENAAARLQHLELGQVVSGTVAATGQPMVLEDVQRSTDERTVLIRSLGITAYACHPLVARGRVTGTLAFGTRQRTHFDPESLALIQTLASQVATAIERKHSEEALRSSEARLRLALDAGSMGIWEWEHDAEFCRWNPREFELIGLPAAPDRRITPQAFLDRVHPEDRDRMVAQTEASLASGKDFEAEFRVICPDGTVRWLAEVGRPQPKAFKGDPDRMVGISYDITERKEMEMERKSVLHHARTIITHSVVAAPEGWDDPEATQGIEACRWEMVVEDEQSALELLPLTIRPGETFHGAWDRSRHPDDVAKLDLEATRALRSNLASFTQTFRILDAHGGTRWFHQVSVLNRIGQGRWRVTSINTDITNIKQAEEALRLARDELEQRVAGRTFELARANEQLTTEIQERSQAELALRRQAALLNMTSDAIIIWELGGRIRYWNRGAAQLYGFSVAEATGHISYELLATDFPQGVQGFLATLTQHGEWGGEITQTTKLGRKVIVESHQQLVEQPDGTLLVLETNHDLTERVTLHEEIVAAGERERQRLGQNLHDGLCQLLTAARLKADSLQARLTSHDPATVTSAKSLITLVTQSVDEARNLARGLEPVEELPEGLMVALQQLAASTRRLFGVACTCDFPLPVHTSDHRTATELFRIAQEAVNNAIKHSHASIIRIRLADEAGQGILTITSDGKPFPKRPRITGMGLKTMRFRADHIGATLEIKRGPRKGALVRCALPRVLGSSFTTQAAHFSTDQLHILHALSHPAAPDADTGLPKKGPTS